MSDASKLSLEIQIGRGDIGALVGDKLAEAIDAELSKRDVGTMIAAKLNAPQPSRDWLYRQFVYSRQTISNGNPSFLDGLIDEAITAKAKAYIDRHLAGQRDSLEHSFAEMLQRSQAKLTKAFCASMVNAVGAGVWRFDFGATVVAAQAESEDA